MDGPIVAFLFLVVIVLLFWLIYQEQVRDADCPCSGRAAAAAAAAQENSGVVGQVEDLQLYQFSTSSTAALAFVWKASPFPYIRYDFKLITPTGREIEAQDYEDNRAPLPKPYEKGDYTIYVNESNRLTGDIGPTSSLQVPVDPFPGAPVDLELVRPDPEKNERFYVFRWKDGFPGNGTAPEDIKFMYSLRLPDGHYWGELEFHWTMKRFILLGELGQVAMGNYELKVAMKNDYGMSSFSTLEAEIY